jgi:hypothetical protein
MLLSLGLGAVVSHCLWCKWAGRQVAYLLLLFSDNNFKPFLYLPALHLGHKAVGQTDADDYRIYAPAVVNPNHAFMMFIARVPAG